MKKIFVLLILTLVALSCEKDKRTEPRKHPYFSCKINGESFYAQGKWQCYPWTFNYYPNGFLGAPIGYTVSSGLDCYDYKSVGIRIYGFDPNLDSIDFNSNQVDSVSPFYSDFNDYGAFDKLISGSVKFIQFADKSGDTNGIVTGTFEFTVRNEELDSIVEITEGKFQYIIDYEWY